MNTLKVGVLLIALTALFLYMGELIGGRSGILVAFSIAMLMNVISYWYSDKLVLAMSQARPIEPHEAPELHRLLERLSFRAGIPVPKLYLAPGDQPNAFATGRDPQHAAVAVTEGLLRLLDSEEVEGVIAHELAHIRNRDTLTMTVVATIAGAIMMLAQIARFAMWFGGARDRDSDGPGVVGLLVAIIVAPIAATLIQLAISRAREYEADATGAQIAGSPEGLASALLKLEEASKRLPLMTATQTTAHLYIVNPLRALGGLAGLFMTHPPIPQRVERLRRMNSALNVIVR